MSKFIKRIRKTIKQDLNHAGVVGPGEINLEYIVGGFDTVFFVNYNAQLPRSKNIIKILDQMFLHELASIDIIFVHQAFDPNNFQFIIPLSKKTAPIILLSQDFPISTEYYDFFKRIRYEMVEIIENYQTWKIVKK
jgi:hypothetical protein